MNVQVPPVDTVAAAAEEWRERWPTRFDGAPTLPEAEEDQEPWKLANGFDAVAKWLGGG